MADKPIVIDNFQKGIAQSPLLGFQDIRCCNTDLPVGTLKCGFATKAVSRTASPTITITGVDTTTNIITVSQNIDHLNTSFLVYGYFAFKFVGTLPTSDVNTTDIYYMIRQTSTSFKVASTLTNAVADTAIDLTGSTSTGGTISMILPKKINCFATSGDVIYGLDTDGRLWYDGHVGSGNKGTQWGLIPGNTLPTSGQGGKGIAIYKGYVMCFNGTRLDTLKISDHATWANIQTLDSTTACSPLVGQDDILYYNQTKAIATIYEKPAKTFNPADSSTYGYDTAALDLPENPTALAELGKHLLIGSQSGKIYPWDRISSSFTLPINLPETIVKKMVTVNNISYIFIGDAGNIYYTDGSSYKLFTRIPPQINNREYQGALTWSDASTIKDKLLFTVQGYEESFLMSISLTTGEMKVENKTANGYGGPQSGSSDIAFGGLLVVDGSNYIVSYIVNDTSSFIDNTNTSTTKTIHDNYSSYVISQLYIVGDPINKKTFSTLRINMADKLTLSQGVRISYRENLSDSWTTITTFDASYGLIKSYECGFAATVESIQFKIELNGYATGNTTPSLISVSAW